MVQNNTLTSELQRMSEIFFLPHLLFFFLPREHKIYIFELTCNCPFYYIDKNCTGESKAQTIYF